MVSFFSIIAIGFFLGMRHATDPDHVIAVTTIISRQRSVARAAWIGVFWGIGHSLTILLVGAAIILFGLVIPPRIGLSMEFSVSLMLVVLGIMNIVSFRRSISVTALQTQEGAGVLHSHPHSHGDYAHTHLHGHSPEQAFAGKGLYQYFRSLAVGIVHGLAGSAAVALLVLTTIRNSYWAVAYLLIFGVGTIAGMMLITMSIASTFHFVGKSRRFSQRLAVASGLLSLAFGLMVAYQIGFVNGLFTGHPNWTPR